MLTSRQQEVLDFIRQQQRAMGVIPSMSEISSIAELGACVDCIIGAAETRQWSC